MRQAGEPSVEEILESIKKVIARDVRGEAAATPAPRAPMSAAAAAAAIAPALQAQAGREGAAAPRTAASNPAISMTRAASPADVLDLTDVAAQIMGEYGKPAADAGTAPGTCAEDDEDEALVPREAAASMRDSLAALAMLAQPGAQPQIVRSGETSLEGMVRDMLRPMLAQWLERNLPVMVEKMVAAEIARIAGKRG
ncbi:MULTISPECIES: DUF2497 domain-containing protein [Novosphingobium]|uniref:DUF2497 domain-containing protein n=1 Tax=Novosphingobium TaxID=165696 RepID=UPI0007870BBE|nr:MULTISPECIES: DUF2497 domain-containing protein [Novosphingobium]MBB3359166.1 hypothetical protein [Novosphingobium sp. BK256]MBB3375353.1 hypothetical protein [Novosphingobium sp. BK280]MBB3379938.1 hypothetical protein [Novosphingobium sp. BK258]MBB3421633.1 hypothetical protein [Novosphingobium sp. BK267]MBB3449948.1 hypothetical protein [Novosphingobium sp. BK352]